jgi:hypothetical protein
MRHFLRGSGCVRRSCSRYVRSRYVKLNMPKGFRSASFAARGPQRRAAPVARTASGGSHGVERPSESAALQDEDWYRAGVSLALRATRSRLGRPLWNFMNRQLRMRAPVTLNAKIRYKMLFDDGPLLRRTADKLGLRGYVNERSPDLRCPEVLAVWSRVKDAGLDGLPERFVLKPTHASGSVVIVTPTVARNQYTIRSRVETRRPRLGRRSSKIMIHPDDLTPEQLRSLAKRWLNWDYFEHRGRTEPCYRALEPRVIVEELLEHDGDIVDDVKIWCVDGEPRLVQIDSGRLSSHRQSLFLPSGEPIDADLGLAARHESPVAPPLHACLAAAELLSREFDFVRVDLYATGESVLVGELTHYPNGGAARMSPRCLIDELFRSWEPHRRYGPLSEPQ